MKKALIFGVTGQDGYYLSKLLIKKAILFMELEDENSIVENLRIDEIFLIKQKIVICTMEMLLTLYLLTI